MSNFETVPGYDRGLTQQTDAGATKTWTQSVPSRKTLVGAALLVATLTEYAGALGAAGRAFTVKVQATGRLAVRFAVSFPTSIHSHPLAGSAERDSATWSCARGG